MNYLLAFIFCGFVCVIAQLIYEYSKLTPGHITSLFVVIGALLPITSFGHSLMHGALAATKEFGVFGLAMGIFDLTAAGISSAILFAFLVAICTKPKS